MAGTGTRALLGATIGAADDRDEATLARRLLPLLGPGMLLLLDRGFDSAAFLTAVHRTGAMLLARARSQRVPPVLTHLPEGSYLSELDGLAVRIIEADLTLRGADGTRVGDRYRLITTLLDHRRYPAEALIRLYHERWEIESAYLACATRCSTGMCCVRGPGGVEQELGVADALPAAAHGHGRRRADRPGTTPTGPASPPPCRPPRPAHRGRRDQPRPRRTGDLLGVIGRPCWHVAAARRPATAPAGQMRPPATSTATMAARRVHRRPRDRHRVHPRPSTSPADPDPRVRTEPAPPGQPAGRVTALLRSDPGRGLSGAELARNCRSRSTNAHQLADGRSVHHPHQRRHLTHSTRRHRSSTSPSSANSAALLRGSLPGDP